MIPSGAYNFPNIGCLPGSFPKFNFIKDWNPHFLGRIHLLRLWDGLSTDVTFVSRT
jgi:hypothetical protein